METKEHSNSTINSGRSDWSSFEKVFAKDGEYDSEFNLPRRWNGKDFYADLHGLLDKYIEKLDLDEDKNDSLVEKTKNVRDRVLEIVRIYLHGYPADAYNCMTNLMNMLDEYPMYTDQYSDNVGSLYRMTKVKENINDKAWVFHAPYDIRPKIRTYRYSIAGYPSLYLADSLELCEQEVKYFEKKEKAIVSKYVFDKEFEERVKILDFGFRPQDLACPENEEGKAGEMPFKVPQKSKRTLFKESISKAKILSDLQRKKRLVENGEPYDYMTPSEQYMLWYPLLAACAYVRVNRDDAFAPEYIVPQLITQYLRSKEESELIGIRYFSCYSEIASEDGMNYVFPTSGDPLILKSGVKQFCPVLNEAFLLTEPEYIPEFHSIKDKDKKPMEELKTKLGRKKPVHAFELTRKDYEEEDKVELPNGLMYVAARSFSGCEALKTVGFPEGLVGIGSFAFDGCKSLQKSIGKKVLHIPSSVKRIGNGAFRGCSQLSSVKLNEGLVEIGAEAFSSCVNLKRIEISASVERIGAAVFRGFAAPDKISVDKNNEVFRLEDNCIIERRTCCLVAGAKLRRSGDRVLTKIPKCVSKIGRAVFMDCASITEIGFPNGLKEIGEYAFMGCTGIAELKLPDKLETIGFRSFGGCTGITELKLPDKLETISPVAFAGCTGITELKLPDNLETIGPFAFEGCTGITELKLPDGLAAIDFGAFAGCTGITELKLPDNLARIGFSAFKGCTGIKRIEYSGTMEQWKMIKTDGSGIEGHTIICTDGEILPSPENPSDEKSA